MLYDRPCSAGLGCWPSLAGGGLLLEIRGERRRVRAAAGQPAGQANVHAVRPRRDARADRAVRVHQRSPRGHLADREADRGRARRGPGARGRCRVPPLLQGAGAAAPRRRRRSSRPTSWPGPTRSQLEVAAVGLGPPTSSKGAAKIRFPRQAVEPRRGRRDRDAAAARGDRRRRREGRRVRRDRAGRGARARRSPIRSPRARRRSPSSAQARRAGRGRPRAGDRARRTRSQLVRDIGGIDLAVAGLGAAAPEPERVEVEADQGRRRLARDPGEPRPGRVAGSTSRCARRRAARRRGRPGRRRRRRSRQLDQQLAALDADLAKFAADKDADPAFVAAEAGRARPARRAARRSSTRNPLRRPRRRAATSRSTRSASTRRSRATSRSRIA